MKMTLDELLSAMEPQAQKDRALIAQCIDGLTEYAAELRQKDGGAGKVRTPYVRAMIDRLESYWVLDNSDESFLDTFDRRMREADQAVQLWTPTEEQMRGTVLGLYRYATDMIPGQGADYAAEPVTECEQLMREIAAFWGINSRNLDDLCIRMKDLLREQRAWEKTVEMGGIE